MNQEIKTQAIIEALEYYLHQLKYCNANQEAIDLFTEVLKEVNPNDD